MMMCDEKGRGIIEDWHPNGHLRTITRQRRTWGRWGKVIDANIGNHLQYQWERTVIDIGQTETIKETEWRVIPNIVVEVK